MINRPYVTLNVAMTVDGKTDTIARQGAAISSPFDMERVDRLRTESDAMMVGGHTLLGDDPRLTVKSAETQSCGCDHGVHRSPHLWWSQRTYVCERRWPGTNTCPSLQLTTVDTHKDGGILVRYILGKNHPKFLQENTLGV